jgi:hypothetical protein
MIYRVERDSQAALRLVEPMTIFAADRSTQRTIVVACIIFAMLALPVAGALHCQVMHDAHGHASMPLAGACCVFLCFTAFIGMVIIPLSWLTIAHAALNLKPVRLASHLIRWVPPPRPISSLA